MIEEVKVDARNRLVINGKPGHRLRGRHTWNIGQQELGRPDIMPQWKTDLLRYGHNCDQVWVWIEDDGLDLRFNEQVCYNRKRDYVRWCVENDVLAFVMLFNHWGWGGPQKKTMEYPSPLWKWQKKHIKDQIDSLGSLPCCLVLVNEGEDVGFQQLVADEVDKLNSMGRPVYANVGSNGTESSVANLAKVDGISLLDPTDQSRPWKRNLIGDTDHIMSMLKQRDEAKLQQSFTELSQVAGCQVLLHMQAVKDGLATGWTGVRPGFEQTNVWLGQQATQIGGGVPPPPSKRFDIRDFMIPDDDILGSYKLKNITTMVTGDRIWMVKDGGGFRWDVWVFDSAWLYLYATNWKGAPGGSSDPSSFVGQYGYKELTKQAAPIICRPGFPGEVVELGRTTMTRFDTCEPVQDIDLGDQEKWEVHAFGTAGEPDITGVSIGGEIPDDTVTIVLQHHYGNDRSEDFVFAQRYGWVRHLSWRGGVLEKQQTFNRLVPGHTDPLFPCDERMTDPNWNVLGGGGPPPPGGEREVLDCRELRDEINEILRPGSAGLPGMTDAQKVIAMKATMRGSKCPSGS